MKVAAALVGMTLLAAPAAAQSDAAPADAQPKAESDTKRTLTFLAAAPQASAFMKPATSSRVPRSARIRACAAWNRDRCRSSRSSTTPSRAVRSS